MATVCPWVLSPAPAPSAPARPSTPSSCSSPKRPRRSSATRMPWSCARQRACCAWCPESRVRIATWNVNSLKARLEKVAWWLERAQPDVLLMQETKLADKEVPMLPFKSVGYDLAHHGEGRWNGVAIASRCGIADVVTNFGEPLRPAKTPDAGDDEPLAEARMIAATCGGVRVVCVYAPNGRVV